MKENVFIRKMNTKIQWKNERKCIHKEDEYKN